MYANPLINTALLGLVLPLAGCTSRTAVFPDRTPEQVWTVMVTAAEFPDHPDWTLVSNDVWIDPNFDRLEIHRRLKRDYHYPKLEPVRQVETYDMQFILERTEPPAVTGTIRNAVIPVNGNAQIELFFEQLRSLLSPIPSQSLPDDSQAGGSGAVGIEIVELDGEGGVSPDTVTGDSDPEDPDQTSDGGS